VGTNGKRTLIRPVQFKKKKRNPSVNAAGQGRKLSIEKYNDLYASYARTGDVSKSAHEAGVSLEVARRYIKEGSADFPAIQERLDLVNQRAFEDQDDILVRQRRMFQEAAFDAGKELIAALQNATIQLVGRDLVGADGNKVLGSDGKPVRVITETTLGNAVSVLQKLQDMFDRAKPENSVPDGGINLSKTEISIHMDAAKAAQEGESVLRLLNASQGGKQEEILRSLVAEEARRRGTQEAQDVIDIEVKNDAGSDE